MSSNPQPSFGFSRLIIIALLLIIGLIICGYIGYSGVVGNLGFASNPTPSPDQLSLVSGATAAISVIPADQQMAVGATAQIQVQIENVSGLAAADIKLRFNPAFLQVVDADPSRTGVQVQLGSFPKPDFLAINNVDNVGGIIHYVVAQLPPSEPANGTGIAFSVTFRGVTDGTADLTFDNFQLAKSNAQAIVTIPKQGRIIVGNATPAPPTANPTSQPPTATPTPTSTPIGNPAPNPPTSSTRYVVQYGDTLYAIARRFGVSLWKLAAYNNIYNPNIIYAGQVLIIPGSYPPGTSPDTGYTVRHGDTLYSIARRFGYQVSDLIAYNHISNPNLIYVGQLIQFPPR